MSDNISNNKRSVYNKEIQYDYKKDLLQMSFRFSKNEREIELATRQYMSDYKLSSGGLAKMAVIEKMIREGYLNDQNND